MAAAEFSLGGFIKLDSFWDSTQENKNMNSLILRNNNFGSAAGGAFHHGKLKFTAQGTRFNFTIKGPKLWGATTTGFIEIDFDRDTDAALQNAQGASNGYTPRMRHAFFRMNWPETELLMGQYFSMFSRWYPELAQDGHFQLTGTPTARLAQIRLTQKFMDAWTVAALVGEPNGITGGQAYSALDRAGANSTETPQVQARLEFAQDLYGKGAWYGKPTPFTAEVVAGWQRGIIQEDTADRTLFNTGQFNLAANANARTRHQYLDPWIVMGNLFIPVIPTHSANLAGTASIQTGWWIGQGAEAFGWIGLGSQVYRFQGFDAGGNSIYEAHLMNRWGGQVQAQYYFTNQWFLTGAFGFTKAFNVGAHQTDAFAPNNRRSAFTADTANYHQEYALCLWYRPITAFKFGLQYAFAQTTWFQKANQGGNNTGVGEAHRVEFVGLFFF
jgi:hypothetical protein